MRKIILLTSMILLTANCQQIATGGCELTVPGYPPTIWGSLDKDRAEYLARQLGFDGINTCDTLGRCFGCNF